MWHKHQAQGQPKPSFPGCLQGGRDKAGRRGAIRQQPLESLVCFRIFNPKEAASTSHLLTHPSEARETPAEGPVRSQHHQPQQRRLWGQLTAQRPPCWGADSHPVVVRSPLACPPHTWRVVPQLLLPLRTQKTEVQGSSVEMYTLAVTFSLLSKNFQPWLFIFLIKTSHGRVSRGTGLSPNLVEAGEDPGLCRG